MGLGMRGVSMHWSPRSSGVPAAESHALRTPLHPSDLPWHLTTALAVPGWLQLGVDKADVSEAFQMLRYATDMGLRASPACLKVRPHGCTDLAHVMSGADVCQGCALCAVKSVCTCKRLAPSVLHTCQV